MNKPIIALSSLFVAFAATAAVDDAATDVIKRFAGENIPVEVSVSLDKNDGRDVYETTVTDGRLTVKASSGVAACRGFYDFVKNNGAGIIVVDGQPSRLARNAR